MTMLRSCAVCGRVHDAKVECRPREWAPRKSRAAVFRGSPKWKAARRAVRERDCNACRWCLAHGDLVTDGLSVHHIIPLEEDFALRAEPSNLVTLCSACHEAAEAGKISRESLIRLVRERPSLPVS